MRRWIEASRRHFEVEAPFLEKLPRVRQSSKPNGEEANTGGLERRRQKMQAAYEFLSLILGVETLAWIAAAWAP